MVLWFFFWHGSNSERCTLSSLENKFILIFYIEIGKINLLGQFGNMFESFLNQATSGNLRSYSRPLGRRSTKKYVSSLQVLTLILVGIGMVFVLIFQCGTKEPCDELDKKMSTSSADAVVVIYILGHGHRQWQSEKNRRYSDILSSSSS